MSIDFATLQGLEIPEGVVTQIAIGDTLVWQASKPEIIASGYCGNVSLNEGKNVTWTLTDDGVITISGEGAMDRFSSADPPWRGYSSDITTVVIENGVTLISQNAFAYYDALTSVTIPASVIGIYNFAFIRDSGYASVQKRTIEVLAETPPYLYGTAVFDPVGANTIIVPAGCSEAYKADSKWSEYASDITEAV